MLLRQLHQEIAGILKDAGIGEPRREAALLLAHFLDLPLAALYARPEQPVDSEVVRCVSLAAARRADHVPMAYILGETGFAGLTFAVGPGVLVPRPDSEILVETAFQIAASIRRTGCADAERPAAAPLMILDACAGTGCVGISLAVRLRQAGYPVSLWLTDIDPQAAAYARRNLVRHGLNAAATLEIADLWPQDRRLGWDLVVANPPYIRQSLIPELMPEVSRYEPPAALDGGPDGLDVLRRLTHEAADRLNPGGCLLLEHGYDQAKSVAALILAAGRYDLIPAVRDYGGRPRVSGGWRK
ncbi:MAG TPA: peptide chain release factor N(5)-glutamine methyltransferase [Clostridiales bacterium]|nr:peptide chain release factor N(5)-glutamine methyltransferase [Clostridiales bacterium]